MGDERAVEEIVYKLKSQGLFDQLRKECLNDVDTKPAYQNLRQRVEGYVSRFLSQQTWSPDLNKNQLRDSLRRQINQSGMLSSGVERIIEQVVNPKIFTIIKPKIDEIVCKHLGIDPAERQRQLQDRKARQQKQLQQQQLQHQQAVNDPQPLMALNTSPAQPPGFENIQGGGSNPYAAYSPSANWHRPFGTMLNPHLNSNYQINQAFSQGFGPYGMTSPLYPYVQQGWSIPPFPGMPPPSMFTQPPPPIPPGSGSDLPVIPQTPQYTEPPPPLPTEPYTGDSDMESVPAPPPEPEPQTTDLTPPGISPVTLPGSALKPGTQNTEKPVLLDIEKPVTPDTDNPVTPGTEKVAGTAETRKEKPTQPETKPKVESKPADGTYNILKDIPLPIPLPRESETNFNPAKDIKKKRNVGNGSRSKDKIPNNPDKGKNGSAKSSDNLSEKYGDLESARMVHNGSKSKSSSDKKSKYDSKDAESKSYHDVATKSEIGLTTENLEKLKESQHAKQYTFSWTKGAEADEVSSMTVSSVHTSDLSSFEDDLSSGSEIEEPVIEEKVPETTEDTAGDSADVSGSQSETVELSSPVKTNPVSVSSEGISPPKPKTLISLKYNYSDSEEEETREERKARIAHEKEERYVKRQQRRAELDAKRKEREEERIRTKEEKKSKLSDSDKTTLSEESETGKPSSPLSDPQKSEESEEKPTTVPSSPKKKTKQELKEQLREQKVMEKKLALRRQRTRNRRYTSEEFTSIFTEKRQPYSSQSYTSVEEVVETEECVVETTMVIEEQTISMEVPETQPVTEVEAESVTESVTVPTSKTPEGSPPGSPKSPATPTQDEPSVYSDGSTALPTGIPVYEISATPATSLTIGQVVHETRSRTRKISDERKSNETHSTGRPGSPFSDISENSKPDSLVDTPERRSKRRRLGSNSPLGVDSAGKAGRRTSAVSPSDLPKSAEGSESRSRGKRYSVDDLYKPRTSHRRSFSPPPSPTNKPKTSTPGGRPRSSPTTDRSMSPPPPGRRRSQPSPPPLAPPSTSKRYDADDLYKPRVPSSRSSRYLQRQPTEPSPSSSKTTTKNPEMGSKRELPFAAKDFSEEVPVEEEREVSPSEAERKRIKRPIAFVDFGEAARRTDQRKPQETKFRGRTWSKDRGRFDRKTQRKYYDGGWSDIEKTGSRSPASSHSSGSGSHFARREPIWKDTYDSEPSMAHRSGSHSPSKLSRTFDAGELSSSSVGRNRSPSNYEQSQSVSGLRPPSPQSPPVFDTRRAPSPYSPGSRHQLSPVSPEDHRPLSPPSPGLHRPPSPPSPGLRRPTSPPSSARRPPSPPSPEPRRPPSPLSPDEDLGPRTRRHRPVSPDPSSGRRGTIPVSTASPVRRQTRNSLYHPVMTGPRVGKGGGWGGRQNATDEGRYLRSRSPGRGNPDMNRDRRSSSRVVKGRTDPSPPPAKRPKR